MQKNFYAKNDTFNTIAMYRQK